MAGHLPIGKGGFDLLIGKGKPFKRKDILMLNDFQREFNEKLNCFTQKLPTKEYKMDEEHGKKDHFVIYFYRHSETNFSYEVHLDKDLEINEVYLVM
jgi:hypothetical protein